MKLTITGHFKERTNYKALTPIPCREFSNKDLFIAYDDGLKAFINENDVTYTKSELTSLTSQFGFEFKDRNIFIPSGVVIYYRNRSWTKELILEAYRKYNPGLLAFDAYLHEDNNIPFELEVYKP